MDLDSAVEFSSAPSGTEVDYKQLLEDFRQKTQEMGFYDQRMTYGSFNEDLEEELKAAYEETQKQDKQLRKLFTITDVLAEKVEEYEHKVIEMQRDKERQNQESGFIKENLDMVVEKENEKDCTTIPNPFRSYLWSGRGYPGKGR